MRSATTTAAEKLSLIIAAGVVSAACSRAAPPSRFPTAADAIARMRATDACSRGVSGEAKVDYFGERGRVRGSTLFVMSRPEKIRFDVFSPFGLTLSTLTSDGRVFALLDTTSKQYFEGPALECNVARFLQVPVPPFALVDLFAGEAPILVHQPSDATIDWEGGSYVIRIRSVNDASEEIRLEPTPGDWQRAWNEQRVRVREVSVVQRGVGLYRAELDDFKRAATAKPRVDPDGIDADVPPSGPACNAEIPRHLRIISDASAQDVIVDYKDIAHNPPIVPGLFRQSIPPGAAFRYAICH
jgi:outer membrane lipoprotein-sorting protein